MVFRLDVMLVGHQTHSESWWWQHQAAGIFLSSRSRRLVKAEGEMNAAKYSELLEDILIQSVNSLQQTETLHSLIQTADENTKHT